MSGRPQMHPDNSIKGPIAEARGSHTTSHGNTGKPQRKLDKYANQSQEYGKDIEEVNTSPSSDLERKDGKLSSMKNSPTPQDAYAGSNVDAITEGTSPKLQSYSKEYLIRRVVILEHELKKQNSACAHLLQQCRALSPLRKENEAQKEMIVSQQRQIELLQAEKASSSEQIRLLRKEISDKEHQERVDRVRNVIGKEPPRNASDIGAGSGRPRGALPGGTVVNTRMGPQIVYDSSSISSVGFSRDVAIPLDFLGGPDVQSQLQQRGSGARSKGLAGPQNADRSEEAGLHQVLQIAKDEAKLSQKYREMERREEQELQARLEALRLKK
ncbi:unnamed protein product [Phytomonas sp. EM1]|nr:unnamed protein product [Phytomonas sp. EM1]|eukprot:CCW63115.1 unnamed protein product [Phytomonas sp. isolate EM1]